MRPDNSYNLITILQIEKRAKKRDKNIGKKRDENTSAQPMKSSKQPQRPASQSRTEDRSSTVVTRVVTCVVVAPTALRSDWNGTGHGSLRGAHAGKSNRALALLPRK